MSWSRQTITRRIAELSADIKDQVLEQSKSLDWYLIACDESTDASEITTQKNIETKKNSSEMKLKNLKAQKTMKTQKKIGERTKPLKKNSTEKWFIRE